MRKNKSLLFVVAMLIFLAGSILVAACGPASMAEPTATQTKELIQEPIPTETIKPTVTPGFTPTEESTPTATPVPTEITDDLGVEMVLVPEGEFTMGEDVIDAWTECQKWRYDCSLDQFEDLGPIHQVYLDAFYMDKYEITNALYRDCVDSEVCEQPIKISSYTRSDYFENPEFDNYPVIYVTWEMANAFCEWREARLPTEAEWEKAARGVDSRTFPWGEGKVGCEYANISMPCKGDTTKVGSYPRDVSPYSVYDMAGNVTEWVADWYSENYYEISPFENPPGPEAGKERVVRGSFWINSKITQQEGKIVYRNAPSVKPVYPALGFRCAKNVTP